MANHVARTEFQLERASVGCNFELSADVANRSYATDGHPCEVLSGAKTAITDFQKERVRCPQIKTRQLSN